MGWTPKTAVVLIILLLHMQRTLDEMAAELQEMLTRSEVLGEEGDVDGSQAAATQAEAIKASLPPPIQMSD